MDALGELDYELDEEDTRIKSSAGKSDQVPANPGISRRVTARGFCRPAK
jgi:hypothetical protein